MSEIVTIEMAPGDSGARQQLNYQLLRRMAHSPIYNYAIPGLTSWLIGAPSKHGCVRMFQCDRMHPEAITPHSHRFDFDCLVLDGAVTNHRWVRSEIPGIGDEYAESTLHYRGKPGQYDVEVGGSSRWYTESLTYGPGECYGMAAAEVQSINFSRGARVLFFEGPTVSDTSVVLEPVCNGVRVPTFSTEPWMFKRGRS